MASYIELNDLGSFASINALWAAHPEGGQEGDYCTIAGVKYRWDKYDRMWVADPNFGPTPARSVTTFDGDVNMQNNLTVAGYIRAKGIKQPCLGLFLTYAALTARWPEPEVGAWALVGDDLPAELYVYDATDGWKDTGNTVDIDEVDLSSIIINGVKGWVPISSTSDLPLEPSEAERERGYLLGTTLYVYVGTGGDTLDGKYLSAQLKGADGERGADGQPGAEGKSAYQCYYDTTSDNPKKTEEEWLASLKGADGVSLGDVEIADNCTTNDATKVLSAKQGYELKNIVDKCASIETADKIILNQPLLDLIGVEGVDYAVIENMKFSNWNGNITTATGNYLILVTMKNGVISHKGLPISGYHGWWTADVKPSTSDPTVDEDGNAVAYTKTYYNNGTRSNVAVAKPYLLFDAGTDVSNFVMAFLSFIPTPIYDVKSVNDGIRIVSSSIDGVGNKTLELLQKGIATKNNSLDTNCVIGGMKFDVASPFKLLADANSSIYLQPIPSGAQNVVVRGLQGTSGMTYHRVFILNDSLTIIANDNIYGTTVVNQYVSLENVAGAKYLAFNASGTDLAHNLDDVVVVFDVPALDYTNWMTYHNNFSGEQPQLDIATESEGLKNYLSYDYLSAKVSSAFDMIVDNITEHYITFILPDGGYVTTADTLVQYDENDNVLKSETMYTADCVNMGKRGNHKLMQVHLVTGCVKVKFRIQFELAFAYSSLEEMVGRGNKVLITDRIIEWGDNKIKSINGVSLNHKAKTPLSGKLICCMGDSITDFGSNSTDGSYAFWIQKNYDCGVANYGRGNAHFCDSASTDPTANTNPGIGKTSSYPNNVVSTQVRWCINELTTDNIIPDAIILSGCTNDAYGTVELGDLSTALAAYPMTTDAVHTDFYGAAVYMVSKLRAAWPGVKIIFATPPRSLNPSQMTRLEQYVEAMRNVAKALGCGVIDFFDESLIQYPAATYNSSSETWSHSNPMYNTNDVLHPSQLGVNIMGALAASKLCYYLAK